MSDNKNFFDFIHMLRGVAVMFVVWSHLGGWWLSFNGYSSIWQEIWETSIVEPFHLYQNGGHLGVLIFFLISGFIITHVSLYERTTEFIVKRIFRVFPPLAVSMLVVASVVNLCLYYKLPLPLGMGDHSFSEYIQSLFLINYITGTSAVNGVTWTLLIEIIFYTITAILIKRTKRNPISSTYLFIIAIVVFVCISPFNNHLKSLANFAVYVLFLLLGRIYYLHSEKIIDIKNSIPLGTTCFFLYISFYEFLYPGMLFSAPKPAYPVIFSDLLAIVIFLIFANISTNINKAARFLANTSYSVYLLHLPVGGLVLVVLDKQRVPFEISFIFSLVICFLASYLMFIIIERPSQNFVRFTLRSVNKGT